MYLEVNLTHPYIAKKLAEKGMFFELELHHN